LAALAESAERIAGEVTEVETALQAAEADRAALPDLAVQQRQIQELRAALAERRGALTTAEADLQRLAREVEARQERLLAIGRHQAELSERRDRLQAEIAALAERPGELASRRELLVEQVEQAEAARKTAADALAAGEAAQSETDRALRAAEQELAQAREQMVR